MNNNDKQIKNISLHRISHKFQSSQQKALYTNPEPLASIVTLAAVGPTASADSNNHRIA